MAYTDDYLVDVARKLEGFDAAGEKLPDAFAKWARDAIPRLSEMIRETRVASLDEAGSIARAAADSATGEVKAALVKLSADLHAAAERAHAAR